MFYKHYVEILVDILIGGVFAVFFFLFVILIKRVKLTSPHNFTKNSIFNLNIKDTNDAWNILYSRAILPLSMQFEKNSVNEIKTTSNLNIRPSIKSSTPRRRSPQKHTSSRQSPGSRRLPGSPRSLRSLEFINSKAICFQSQEDNNQVALASELDPNRSSTSNSMDYFAGTEIPRSISSTQNHLIEGVPHCIGILSITTSLTNFIMKIMENSDKNVEMLSPIKSISKYANEVKLSLYPPLDLELVQEKLADLVEALTDLIEIAKHHCQEEKTALLWINKCLAEIESHILSIQKVQLFHKAKSAIRGVLGSQFVINLYGNANPIKYFSDDWESYDYYPHVRDICSNLSNFYC